MILRYEDGLIRDIWSGSRTLILWDLLERLHVEAQTGWALGQFVCDWDAFGVRKAALELETRHEFVAFLGQSVR
jgi:hypothetical protein